MRKLAFVLAVGLAPALAFAGGGDKGQQAQTEEHQQGMEQAREGLGQAEEGIETAREGVEEAAEREGQQAREQGQETMQQGQQAMAQAQKRDIQGEITRVDQQKGTIHVRDRQGEELKVHASPQQLSQYQQGQQADFSVESYGQNMWLEREAAGSQAQAQAGGQAGGEAGGQTAQQQTAAGQVTTVNQQEGTLTLREDGQDRDFQAHPQDLEGVLPGQMVSVTYEKSGERNWAQEVERASIEGDVEGAIESEQRTGEGLQQPPAGSPGGMQAPPAEQETAPAPQGESGEWPEPQREGTGDISPE